jgi:hypothetical protein
MSVLFYTYCENMEEAASESLDPILLGRIGATQELNSHKDVYLPGCAN